MYHSQFKHVNAAILIPRVIPDSGSMLVCISYGVDLEHLFHTCTVTGKKLTIVTKISSI